ncbi:MAG: hypothetical protein NT092_13295 [Bacteroidia bacterium]|nr:hypothetical protein [Bacteroidia bacterium]
MMSFDESECSTRITLTIDNLYHEYGTGIHVAATMKGGVGQYIHSVGFCWSTDHDVTPIKNSNSIFIPYSSIVKGYQDINADGLIDQRDFEYDGGFVQRSYSAVIHPDLTGVDGVLVRAFVSLNDSLVVYGFPEWLPVNKR